MKISVKINLLILISVFALTGIFMVSSQLKKKELKYYILEGEVKKLQVAVLNALVNEKNYEKTYQHDELVFLALDSAIDKLHNMKTDLLGNIGQALLIEKLLKDFKTSFTQMIANSNELLTVKASINRLSKEYSKKHLKADAKILRSIADSLLYENMDITALQELKNTSLTAFSYISEIILLVNQDLILAGDVDTFKKKYKIAIGKLATQEQNLRFQVKILDDEIYIDLSKELIKTLTGIRQTIPELIKSFAINLKISRQLQDKEQQISKISNEISSLSEIIRKTKSRRVAIIQIIGQAIVVVLLLIGGTLFGKSITKPLSELVSASHALWQEPKESATTMPGQPENSSAKDEISILANGFRVMEHEIHKKVTLLRESEQKYRNLFESSIDAILLLDPETGYVDCNPAAFKLFGIESKKQLIKLTPADLSPQYQPDGAISSDKANIMIANALETGSIFFEWTHKRLNGEKFYASVLVTFVKINGRTILHGTIRDISDNKRTQKMMVQSEKMLSVGGLAAGMAHEINNPLAGMLQTADVISA